MCLMIALVFGVISFTFLSKGLVPHAIISAIVAFALLFFFVRKLITNGRCIFGKATDCNTSKDM